MTWAISNVCPDCGKALVLRSNRDHQHFVVCLGYPQCKFVSDYAQLVHALIDRIVELEDAIEGQTQERPTRE